MITAKLLLGPLAFFIFCSTVSAAEPLPKPVPLTAEEARSQNLKPTKPPSTKQLSKGILFSDKMVQRGGMCYVSACFPWPGEPGGARTVCYTNEQGCQDCYTDYCRSPREPRPPRQ